MLKFLNLPAIEFTNSAKEYILSGGADGLVVWVPNAARLMPSEGSVNTAAWTSSPDSWNPNEPSPDSIIDWAHAHNLKVIMVQDFGVAGWMYGGRPAFGPPSDLTSTGPWAQCLRNAMKRHPNTYGIVVGNEPNIQWKGYAEQDKAAAQMVRTAAKVAQECNYKGNVLMFGIEDDENNWAQGFLEWTLRDLNGWRPPSGVKMGMAWHPYTDVSYGQTWRLQNALDKLKKYNWCNDYIWCTEGGLIYSMYQVPGPYPDGPDSGIYFNYHDEATQEQQQLNHITNQWSKWKATGKVICWTNYEYQEMGWAGWASGLVDKYGKPHPIHDAWRNLK